MSRQRKVLLGKSRLQFDIDRMIKQSKDWDEFLRKMAELGYEIKYGNILLLSQKISRDLPEPKQSEKITLKKD